MDVKCTISQSLQNFMFTTYTPFLISTIRFIFNKCSRTLLHSTCNVEPQQNIFLSMAGEENVNHNKNQNKKEDTEKKVGMV